MTRPPFPSLLPMAACLAIAMSAPALAANTCDALYNAGVKSIQTPHHVFSTMTRPGGKPVVNEAVYAGGVEYAKINGQWKRSPMKPQDMVEIAQEKLKTHPDTCTLVGDQNVGGQAVTVYKAHNNEMGTDQLVRILKANGLMQGGSVSLPTGLMEIRYEYANVQAPAGAQ